MLYPERYFYIVDGCHMKKHVNCKPIHTIHIKSHFQARVSAGNFQIRFKTVHIGCRYFHTALSLIQGKSRSLSHISEVEMKESKLIYQIY